MSVLSARHRLHRPADFSAVIRYGARAGRSALVVHLLAGSDSVDPAAPLAPLAPAEPVGPARVGFVVPRTVGNAVIRNRVTRRLRALSAELVARPEVLRPGSRLVVRALPPAATTSYAELGAQLGSALAAAGRRAGLAVSR